jgi:hypothetical protein
LAQGVGHRLARKLKKRRLWSELMPMKTGKSNAWNGIADTGLGHDKTGTLAPPQLLATKIQNES